LVLRAQRTLVACRSITHCIGEWDDLASGYQYGFFKLLWQQTGLEPSAERVVVNFGCGTGLLTESKRLTSPKSEFTCLDAAPAIVRALQDKIQAGECENIKAHCVALANYDDAAAEETAKNDLEALKGKVDLVVASSVMSFVPSEDLLATMKVIGELLKPGGMFCHSDWPKGEENGDGFTVEKATLMYGMAGLETKSMIATKVRMGPQEADIFVGVAVKPGS
jgi:2-polyprenyl-3-methyl-5-hydroxy-6-metoxy-1,4-benzoquinol methylase